MKLFNLKCIFITVIVLISTTVSAESKTLERILKTKTLTVSVNKFYEPFYISDPKPDYPGLDVEIASEYAKYLGVSLKILPLRDFDEHSSHLAKGNADIAIAAISTSLSRSKKVTFTDPYLFTSPAGLVNKNILPPEPEGQIITSIPFRSLIDLSMLSGISFAVRANTTNHDWLKKNFKKQPIYSYLDDFRAINELRKNNVNVYVADSYRIQAMLQIEPSLKSNYLPLLSVVQEEHIAMAVQEGDLELLYNLNFFIREIRRNGWLNKRINKYFSTSDWVTK